MAGNLADVYKYINITFHLPAYLWVVSISPVLYSVFLSLDRVRRDNWGGRGWCWFTFYRVWYFIRYFWNNYKITQWKYVYVKEPLLSYCLIVRLTFLQHQEELITHKCSFSQIGKGYVSKFIMDFSWSYEHQQKGSRWFANCTSIQIICPESISRNGISRGISEMRIWSQILASVNEFFKFQLHHGLLPSIH